MSDGHREELRSSLANYGDLVTEIESRLTSLRIARAVVVVCSLGLDRVSQINDTWGYETGDGLLRDVEIKLRQAFDTDDQVVRIAGDQFLIICTVREGDDVEAEIAERTARVATGRYEIGSHALYVTASIGVAGTADADDDPASLLSAAECARVSARHAGGSRWERADQAIRVRVHEQVRTEQALHDALSAGEIGVRYQPVVSLSSGEMIGFEALARWRSPQLGSVPPSYFVQRAEETGLIVELGRHVLVQVRRDWSAWSAAAPGLHAPAVAVNVSATQLRLDSAPLVAQLIDVAGALPGRLSVEFTESLLLGDSDALRGRLEELRRHGIGLVIDDFGTGYSSLSQLRTTAVDAIKIDRLFVSRIQESARDRAVVDAMIKLAHALGILAIAEGVETEPQLAALHEMGCDQVQGFLFSPALDYADVEALVRVASAAPPSRGSVPRSYGLRVTGSSVFRSASGNSS